MPRYQRHLFVCVNERPPDNPKGCCSAKASRQVRELLKEGLQARGLSRHVRSSTAGCLDACASGATVVIYPEGVWYGGVTVAELEDIIEKHEVRGEVVERLLIPLYAGGPTKFPPLDLPPAGANDEARRR